MTSVNTNNPEKHRLYLLRNVGIIAHVDSGKTTTTERILFLCKQIHKIGEVHEGSTQTDFMDLERERGITICSACVTVNWAHIRPEITKRDFYTLNIIDTPGHLDFKAEVERSLRVMDGVVLVMDGKEGVEPQTETVWRQADKYKIPRIVFVNKMDGVEDEQRFDKCIISIKELLKANAVAVQIPIGAGKEFKGVIDLISQKAFFFSFGDKEEKFTVGDIPLNLQEKANSWRNKLLESIIVFDDELTLFYLEGGQLNEQQIRSLLRKATLLGLVFPVFCGSAYQDVAVNLLLDGVLDYLPSPLDLPPVLLYKLKDDKENDSDEKALPQPITSLTPFDYLALAFKVSIDSFGSTLTFVRVYAGQISTGSYVYNINQQKEERISVLVRMSADKESRINIVKTGEIAVIKGLKYTMTGDTFSSERKKPLVLEQIVFDKPVISKAFVPKNNSEAEKLIEALKKKCFEDPSLSFEKKNTGELIVHGLGELHLEILEETLKRDYKLSIKTEEPKISYKETIKNSLKVTTRYKKQSGGHGHFAEVTLLFEPNEESEDFVFINKIRGDAIPKNFAEATSKGIKEALANGLLLGFPVVKVKATLLDGLTHPVDSSDRDFKQAGIISCRENKEKLGLTLLEPIMEVSVSVPKEYMGDVLANLGSLRMVLENTEEEDDIVKINGKAPLEKMLSYTVVLRKLTKGRGRCILFFSHYQEIPTDVLNRIIKKNNE